MPSRGLRPCPVCHKTTDGTCCQDRPNAHTRGYDREWSKLKRQYQAANPLCELCLEQSRTTPAQLVHHVIPIHDAPQLRLVWSNLQSLCAQHHQEVHHEC